MVEPIPPVIVDHTPAAGTTGDDFTFSAEVTDDSGTAQVRVKYWFGANVAGALNVSMDYNTGNNRWEYTITHLQTVLRRCTISYSQKITMITGRPRS